MIPQKISKSPSESRNLVSKAFDATQSINSKEGAMSALQSFGIPLSFLDSAIEGLNRVKSPIVNHVLHQTGGSKEMLEQGLNELKQGQTTNLNTPITSMPSSYSSTSSTNAGSRFRNSIEHLKK